MGGALGLGSHVRDELVAVEMAKAEGVVYQVVVREKVEGGGKGV